MLAQATDRLVILDVGQGDCAWIQTQGVSILIDDGPINRAGESVALKALRRVGANQVDLILLSHPDADHVAGTGPLLKAFPEASLVISAWYRNAPKLAADLTKWEVPPDHIIWLSGASTLAIGSSRLEIVCPPVSTQENDNDGSMFVRVCDEGATAVFSGDAPAAVEDRLIPIQNWRADLLHVGHHGSKTSTGLAWLKSVHPRVAAISCGVDNPYGHPHRETLERLSHNQIAVERTDRQGDLEFAPQGGHYVPMTRH